MFKIFFWLNAKNWFLPKQEREKRKIDYYLKIAEKKERELLLFESDPKKKLLKELDIDLKYNKISEYDYDIKRLDILYDENSDQKQIEKLNVLFKYKKINEIDYEKSIANIKKEPWVKVVNFSIENLKDGTVFIELNWNDYFIQYLKSNNFRGSSDDQIVENWFKSVVGSILELEKNEPVSPQQNNMIKLNENRTVYL